MGKILQPPFFCFFICFTVKKKKKKTKKQKRKRFLFTGKKKKKKTFLTYRSFVVSVSRGGRSRFLQALCISHLLLKQLSIVTGLRT